MLFQSAVMVAKKLPVDELVSNIYVSWVFYFLENVCYQYLNFVLRVTYCFFTNS